MRPPSSPATSSWPSRRRFGCCTCSVVIEHGTRRLAHVNVTAHPSTGWTLQQLREVIGDAESHKYLIHDRDAIFAQAPGQFDQSPGSRSVALARREPEGERDLRAGHRHDPARVPGLDDSRCPRRISARSCASGSFITTADVHTARWDPVYPALPQDLHAARSPNPDVDGRRVRPSERNPCWADCTTSTRFRGCRRSPRTLLGLLRMTNASRMEFLRRTV